MQEPYRSQHQNATMQMWGYGMALVIVFVALIGFRQEQNRMAAKKAERAATKVSSQTQK